jgi:hypothetical protein
MERSSALYHVQRIHSMTRGLRIPIAFPHDGHTHDTQACRWPLNIKVLVRT